MDDFTKEERARIDILYATDFKDAKPDDFKLISRFERFLAKQETEHNEYIKAIKEESTASIAQAKRISDKAIRNLNALHDAALSRLENIENGF